VNIQDAIKVIESVSGFTDESTPVGEAWAEVLSFIHCRPTVQPEPVAVSVSVAVSDALIKAECALSDVAEGEPECDDGDPAQWAEQRCAETLAIIRPVMQLHKIRTSEWPPQPMPTPANTTGGTH
jgi:hypothetical protein